MTSKPDNLVDLRERVDAGEPLTADDGLRLYASRDIHTLGELANTVRERLHGRQAFYNINRHINYTNYCVLRCKFCSFYRPYPKRSAAELKKGTGTSRGAPSDGPTGQPLGASPLFQQAAESAGSADNDGGYELSIDDIVALARSAYGRGATEVHVVGGLHPKLPFGYYVDLCAAVREACPHMHIKAFTAIEIIHFSRIARPRLTIAEVLTELRDAGLGSLPGGGAEIFDDRVHEETFTNKVGEVEWFEVHRIAHELGLFTNATMLYGHIETPAERVGHLLKLRQHQEESLRSRPARFNCVVPLSFVPAGSALAHLPGPSGLDDLKTLAISRLMCSNIPHIKAFWIMLSPKLAQVSLNWGVDDIDGTVVYYDITKSEPRALARAASQPGPDDPAGAGCDSCDLPPATRQELTVDQLRHLIVEAGCVPVERDTLYRRVIRDEHTWRIEGAPLSVPCD